VAGPKDNSRRGLALAEGRDLGDEDDGLDVGETDPLESSVRSFLLMMWR
jgi:hypothetical protein